MKREVDPPVRVRFSNPTTSERFVTEDGTEIVFYSGWETVEIIEEEIDNG